MTAPTSLTAERVSRRSFQAADVIRLAQITYRQLDYWTRTGLVHASGHPASGSGDTRWYRDTDVLRVCVVAALVRAGVGLASIREHLDTYVEHGLVEDADVTISVGVDQIRRRITQHRRAAS